MTEAGIVRTLLMAVVTLAAGLAGCIGDAEPPDEPADEPIEVTAGDRIVHYRGADATPIEPSANTTLPGHGAAQDLTPRTVLTGFHGAEPSIGILPSGSIFVQAMDETIRSTDGAATWELVDDYTSVIGRGTQDPFLWTDPDTDRVYWNHNLAATCTALGWSTDEGETWERREAACGLPVVDFQKLSGGPPGPDANPLTGQHPTVLYLCYNKPAQITAIGVCAPSYDGGETWPAEVHIGCGTGDGLRGVGCGRVQGPPAVGPGGTVYVPAGGDGAGCPSLVARSHDSGLTWEALSGPPGSVCMDIEEVDVAPEGTLYALGEGFGGIVHLARSDDGGETWAGPWRVTPPSVASVAFASLAAGQDGRVGVALVGAEAESSQGNVSSDARWHLYTVVTEGAGTPEPVFTSVRATGDPVQVGAICGAGFVCDTPAFEGGRNLRDFIDAATAPNGTFYVAYTDGCTGACAADPAAAQPEDSRDDATAVAWLEGWSLKGEPRS